MDSFVDTTVSMNPYETSAKPTVKSETSQPHWMFSQTSIVFAMALSVATSVLFFLLVTMLFIFPAANALFLIGLIFGTRIRQLVQSNPMTQTHLAKIAYTSTFFLLILPSLQLITGIPIPGYRWIARLAEQVFEALL